MNPFIIQVLQFVVPAAVGIVSVLFAGITIRSNSRLRYFDMFFKEKVNAYNRFLDSIAHCYLDETDYVSSLASAYYQASVFAPEALKKQMGELVDLVANQKTFRTNTVSLLLDDILMNMQKDLNECKSGRVLLGSHPHHTKKKQ